MSTIPDRFRGKVVYICVDDITDAGHVVDADDNGVVIAGQAGAPLWAAAGGVQRFYAWSRLTSLTTMSTDGELVNE